MSKKIDSDFVVDARPIKEGKDPLADGNTLVNPKGSSEDDNVYELLESSDDVRKAEALIPRKNTSIPRPHGYPVQLNVPKIRNVKNKGEEELAETVKSSKRSGR